MSSFTYRICRFVGQFVVMLVCLCASVAVARGGDIVYLTFEETAAFPANPSSVLMNAAYFDVPAGATLKVHLLRGEQHVATSMLTFNSAYLSTNTSFSQQVAAFYPTSDMSGDGQPIVNTTLRAGRADLDAIAAAPGQYRLLWELSGGVIGRTNVATIFPSFVGLKVASFGAGATLSDQKPGSALLFHRYSSNASNAQREDTQITLTNTHPATTAHIRLFLVAGATCQVNDLNLCLAAQQTTTFLMSDLDPGTRGYLMAVATDAAGKPIQFNWLTGAALLKNGALNLSLNAHAVAKRDGAIVAPGNDNLAEMIFDDVNYDRLPSQLGFEGINSQANGANATTLSFYRPLANMASGSVTATVQVTGRNTTAPVLQTSGTVSLACYADTSVSNLRLAPITAANLLPAGSSGWFTASTADAQPLLGVQFNLGTFSGGLSARPLAYATEYRIKIPLATVSCQ